jgi:hypothetical protein
MRLCVDSFLTRNPKWLGRYILGWYVLLEYCFLAFFVLEELAGFIAQAIFFAIAFPWTLWPLFAATCTRRQR